jgi:hypothetical protein
MHSSGNEEFESIEEMTHGKTGDALLILMKFYVID